MLLKGNMVMHIEEARTSSAPAPGGRWEVMMDLRDIEPEEVTEVDMLPPPPPLWPRVWPGL